MRSYAFQHSMVVASLTLVAIFLVNLYKARSRFTKLKRQGLIWSSMILHLIPFKVKTDKTKRMLPHHPIFGHLLLAKSILSKFLQDVHPPYLPLLIRRPFPEVGSVFYHDVWPIINPILAVSSPSAASQFTQEHSLPKSAELRRFLKPITQNKDLVSLEGQLWKLWRSIYNPGFSASHLISMVPCIVNEVSTSMRILVIHCALSSIGIIRGR